MKTKSGFGMYWPRRQFCGAVAALVVGWWLAVPAIASGPYLAPGVPGALALLAPPPAASSAEEQADLPEVWSVFSARTPEEEAAAILEESLTIYAFAPAIGTNFQAGRYPKTEALLAEAAKETGPLIGAAKQHYLRPRPFLLDKRLLLGEPETGFSYPSGHSTLGTVYAALLAELFPKQAEAILAQGRTIGWHRVQIGRHYATDVYAGRVLGQAIVREFMKSAAFQRDLAECRAEAAGQ